MSAKADSNGDSAKARSWNHDTGFALYCLGISTDEIGAQVGVSGRMIRQRAQRDGWQARADKVQTERASRVGAKASKEQEFIRAQECQYARRLMGLAEQILRTIKTADATILDLTRILDLASRLGRLGSGLPLNQVEVTQHFDLGEHLLAAIERAYSTPEQKPIDVVTAELEKP